MPLIKASIKSAKQAKTRNARLQPFKTKMKTAVRKFMETAKSGKKTDLAAMLPEAYKAIDTAAKKGLIHKKNASNKKSLLARTLAAAK